MSTSPLWRPRFALSADPTIPGWMWLNAIDRAEQRRDAEDKQVLELLRAVADRRGK